MRQQRNDTNEFRFHKVTKLFENIITQKTISYLKKKKKKV